MLFSMVCDLVKRQDAFRRLRNPCGKPFEQIWQHVEGLELAPFHGVA